ncbi:hypothetical protein Tco_0891787 [Tanacetum coccineum]|uniref:Gag-Pol polyprotein n=1 Tax=Tanacetum coccineum TaxID=301880 RepID=A0ABQ5C3Y4_9ASTR
MTRQRLQTDSEVCMYALTVSTIEPKNIKEAMTDHSWIESMQDKLNQFERLQVWELVPRRKKELILKSHLLLFLALRPFGCLLLMLLIRISPSSKWTSNIVSQGGDTWHSNDWSTRYCAGVRGCQIMIVGCLVQYEVRHSKILEGVRGVQRLVQKGIYNCWVAGNPEAIDRVAGGA